MSTPYRTRDKLPIEIQPVRRLQARFVLAAIIVTPVRLVQATWWWLVANMTVGAGLCEAWRDHPEGTATVIAGLNVAAGIGYGAYRAYRWAVRELEASEKRSNG